VAHVNFGDCLRKQTQAFDHAIQVFIHFVVVEWISCLKSIIEHSTLNSAIPKQPDPANVPSALSSLVLNIWYTAHVMARFISYQCETFIAAFEQEKQQPLQQSNPTLYKASQHLKMFGGRK
jgi:hypothetical protein